MKYLIGMAHVNRMDLTRKTIKSLEPVKDNVILVDNSPTQELAREYDGQGWNIYIPPVPLLFTQFQNYLITQALLQKCDWYGFIHDDAWTDHIEKIIAKFEEILRTKKVGWIRTNYDAFACYNMKAIKDTGWWDVSFIQYYSDNDYYRRLELAGYPMGITGMAKLVKHPEASRTIRSDNLRAKINDKVFPMSKALYKEKWGKDKNTPGRYSKAYNNQEWHNRERNSIKEWIKYNG